MSEADFHIDSNVSEYIVFMYQTEDLIRACNMDREAVMDVIRAGKDMESAKFEALRIWYDGVIDKMQHQGIEKSGHLSEVKDLVTELFYLHNTLLNVTADKQYQQIVAAAQPVMMEFRDRSDNPHLNDVELCFQAMYMKVLLRLKGVEISEATEEAMIRFRDLLAYLSAQYKRMKSGEMGFGFN